MSTTKNQRGPIETISASLKFKEGESTELTISHPANNTLARTLSLPDVDYNYALADVKGTGDVTLDTTGAAFRTTFDLTGISAARSIVVPDADDTLVARGTTDTLINKTLTNPLITTGGAIDVTAAGSLSIGASVGANSITLGGATSTIAIPGTLQLTGGFKLPDLDDTHSLSVLWNENDTSDRTLNFLVNGADRNISLTGNLTLAGSLTTSGANDITLTTSGPTSVTLPTSGTLATTSNTLDDFAATTSAELASVISDETGSGALVFATSPTLVTPNLGTPSAATLTNATGLPISTGVSGLGTGVATFLATPSSANLATAITDETGSGGSLVFSSSPTLTTPIIAGGTIDVASGTLTIGSTATTTTLACNSSANIDVSGAIITTTGDVRPSGVSGTYDLGSSSTRFGSIYSEDGVFGNIDGTSNGWVLRNDGTGPIELIPGSTTNDVILNSNDGGLGLRSGSATYSLLKIDTTALSVSNKDLTFIHPVNSNLDITLPSANGTLATLAGTETLEAKTLDAATVGGASNDGTDGFALFKDQSADPSAATGDDVKLFAKDKKLFTVDSTGVATEVGSGSGGGSFNYVTNPGAQNDAATGTTVSGSFTRTQGTTETTFSDSYFQIATGTTAASRIDWSLDTLQEKHDGGLMRFSMRIKVPTTTGTYKIGVHDGTNYVAGTELTLTSGANQHWEALFVLDRTVTYTVRFERTAGTTDETFYVDDVIISPEQVVQGNPGTEWESISNPTNFTFSSSQFYMARRGDSMLIRGNGIFSSGPSGQLSITIPNSLTLDTTKVDISNISSLVGQAIYYDQSGNNYYNGQVVANSSTVLRVRVEDGTAGLWNDSSTPVAWAASDEMGFQVEVPIAEWAGSTTFGANSRVEYASHDGTNIVRGPSGAVIPTSTPGASSAFFDITAGFDNIQPTDKFELQYQKAGTGNWTPWGTNEGENIQYDGTNFYGAGVMDNAAGTIGIRQGKYARQVGSTTAWSTALTANSRWRVVKSSNPLGIGAGLATATQPGAINYYAETIVDLTQGTTNFTSGNAHFTRIGNVVTCTFDSVATHSNQFDPGTDNGVIPTDFRPTDEVQNCYRASSEHYTIIVKPTGVIQMNYYTSSTGSTVPRSNVGVVPSITYIIT